MSKKRNNNSYSENPVEENENANINEEAVENIDEEVVKEETTPEELADYDVIEDAEYDEEESASEVMLAEGEENNEDIEHEIALLEDQLKDSRSHVERGEIADKIKNLKNQLSSPRKVTVNESSSNYKSLNRDRGTVWGDTTVRL
jgi:hypothetical protein